MKITVRDYVEADHDAYCKLWGEMGQRHADIYEDPSIASGDPSQYFDEYIGRDDHCGTWVAEKDGHVIGFAGLLDTVGEEGVAEIEPVVVKTDVRGSGIGTKLIKRARDEAKKRNFRFLTIRPVLRNEEAFSLFVRLGFDIVGSIELRQDLEERPERKWKKGIRVHGVELSY